MGRTEILPTGHLNENKKLPKTGGLPHFSSPLICNHLYVSINKDQNLALAQPTAKCSVVYVFLEKKI